MNKILLDTDVVINLLKKKEETLDKLNSLGQCQFYTSPIIIAKIYAGAKNKEIEQIQMLFSHFKTLEINEQIGIISGQYANQFRKAFQGISLEDYLIAGIAKYYGLILWTYNRKHYPMKDIIFI